MSVYYYKPPLFCCVCAERIIQGQEWLAKGCLIPTRMKNVGRCQYADEPMHVSCCLNHIEKHCASIKNWYISDEMKRERTRSHYLRSRLHPSDPDEHVLIHCPFGCQEYRDMEQTYCFTVKDWLDWHAVVCPQLTALMRMNVPEIVQHHMIAEDDPYPHKLVMSTTGGAVAADCVALGGR